MTVSYMYLGIDWGEKRIGLAVGDSETRIASPFIVVKNIEDIIDVIEEELIEEIVIGKPFNMSNIDFELSKNFLSFLEDLKQKVNIPVHEFDERLTSKAADARVGDKKTKASRDVIAAMIILQDFLDSNLSSRT